MKEVWFFGKRYMWMKREGRLELVRWPRLPDIVEGPPTEDGWRTFLRKVEEDG